MVLQRTHIGEKPHECLNSGCEKVSAERSNLEKAPCAYSQMVPGMTVAYKIHRRNGSIQERFNTGARGPSATRHLSQTRNAKRMSPDVKLTRLIKPALVSLQHKTSRQMRTVS